MAMSMAAKLARGLNLIVGSDIASQKSDEFIRTVDPSLTWALCGGFAKHRINVLSGDSGSGKTHLSLLHLGVLMQEEPDAVGFIIDTEFYFHNRPNRVKRLSKFGIDIDRLVVYSTNSPNDISSMLSKLEEQMKNGVRICGGLIDSLGGLSTSSSEDMLKSGEAEKAGRQFGGNAKLLANIIRVVSRMSAENNCTFFLIQHAMDSMDMYNPKPVIKGGQTLRLLSDTMVLFTNKNAKDSKVDLEGDIANTKTIAYSGKTIRVLVDKCRDGVEGRKCQVTLDFENGKTVRSAENLCDIALALGVVYHPEGKNTIWGVKIDDEVVSCRGRDAFTKKLEEEGLVDKVLDICLQTKHKIKQDDIEVDFELEEE